MTLTHLRLLFAAAVPAALGACGGGLDTAERAGDVRATIRTTSHGVPHVTADDYRGVGFGAGYAFARDAICEIAGRFVTVRAERSRFFPATDLVDYGPSRTTNLDSDFFWQRLLDAELVEHELALPAPLGPTAATRELVQGYVLGYNRYLSDTGVDNLPDPRCRGREWVRPITEQDIWLRAMHWNMWRSSGGMVTQIVAAAPPPASATATSPPAPGARRARRGVSAQPAGRFLDADPIVRFAQGVDPTLGDGAGSNMMAIGADGTDNGRGMLFANPHWYWNGPERWYEIQLTVPGRLNVTGIQTMGVPVIQTGFTDGVAWAGTSSFAPRYTPYELTLVPGESTSYLYDGATQRMTPNTVTIQVRQPDGALQPRSHTFWETRFGPMIQRDQFVWNGGTGYAFKDVGATFRWVSQQFELNHAQSVGDISEGGKRYMAIGWRNLQAADANGDVFYGDRTAVPHVTDELVERCVTGALGRQLLSRSLLVLDGSRSACEWGTDPDAPVPGIMSARRLPELHRRDYVSQSNDTHWLNNANAPLEGYPLIMGAERTQRSLRTRNGLLKIERRLAGTDGRPGRTFTLDTFIDTVMDQRVLSAELWKPQVVRVCESMDPATGVAPACPILEAFDGTETVESRGAVLWRRFVERLGTENSLYTTPFDPDDPVGTPSGLVTTDSRVETALQAAVQDLVGSGMPLDATYRTYQWTDKNGVHIGVPGGSASLGQYTIVSSDAFQPGVGWGHVGDRRTGSSFIMWMQFTPQGPVGRSVMTYSQSPNPDSPYYLDQTVMYQDGAHKPMRYTEFDILADPGVREEGIECAISPVDRSRCQ